LINRFSDIIDVKRRKRIDSWEALKRQMIRDIKSDWVEEDQWIIEEIIFEDAEKTMPASDVKFYCFYGKVGIILEITRFPELKYCCGQQRVKGFEQVNMMKIYSKAKVFRSVKLNSSLI